MKWRVDKSYVPNPREFQETETAVGGSCWSVELIGSEWVYEYFSGAHGGGTEQYIVTAQDFADVKSGAISEKDLLLKYQKLKAPVLRGDDLRSNPNQVDQPSRLKEAPEQ